MIDYEALGLRVRNARLEKQFTQAYIASEIDVTPKYISDIEKGRGIPSLETLNDIAKLLETSVDSLLCDSSDKILMDSSVYIKVSYDKEVKELLKDLDHDELKLIIEMIKYSKESIKKARMLEHIDKHDKKRNR